MAKSVFSLKYMTRNLSTFKLKDCNPSNETSRDWIKDLLHTIYQTIMCSLLLNEKKAKKVAQLLPSPTSY